ncbi:alpha,alpha-trehalose-phosphate synthase [Geminocystis sp. NIES-3708]|uniref:HAD-IIB family hydrolase n=1 Tax=Geminocystis sp. NIES-3708 TaxID=1615909 RepID=UPI0005FCAA11|nr:HAD-IIB family hydrolase [Geminocystis sp. NIES-3708]BAQ61368.1 alpha,alpha-trehalose-phosphate synthase [Geminocystis sp. NIES-3708]
MINKLLICTDLDRTLIPNGEAEESDNARYLFSQLVANSQVTLAYVTGRDQLLVKNAIAQYQLPLPNFVIADVGSSIYKIENNQWIREDNWDEKIAVDWQNKDYADLIPLFADLKSCRLQEKSKQGLHKLSYYVSFDADVEILIKEIRLRLQQKQIKSNLIWSIDEEASIRLLDILPISANKRHAIEYLMEKQDFTLENTIFSGDSGNDLDVLISPIKSILVANAHEEVKEKVKFHLQTTGEKYSVYIAKGGYLSMNGNYSSGIVEGIFHYFPDIKY